MMMKNSVSPALALIAKEMLGLQMSAEKLEKSMARIGSGLKSIVAGGVGIFAGVEVLKGLKHVADKGQDLLHQQNMLIRNGIEFNEVLGLTKQAYADITKAVPTATAGDVLRVANELVSIKGTLAGAIQALPQALKIEALVSNLTGKSAEGQGYDMWRAIEDKGIIQHKEKVDAWLGAMVHGINATGGKVTGSDFFSYARRAGISWVGDSLESLPLQIMEMQTLGGHTAGVQRRMFGRMIEGGQKLSNKQKAAWAHIGMLSPDGVGMVGKEVESTDPQKFIPMVIAALEAKNIKGLEATKLWAQQALNASSSNYFLQAYTGMQEKDENGMSRLDKEALNLRRALGLDAGYGAMLGRPTKPSTVPTADDPSHAGWASKMEGAPNQADYLATMKALDAQWNSLLQAVGGPVAKAAIPVLQALTEAFNKMGEWANNHQGMTAMIADVAAISAALLTLAGAVAVLRGVLILSGAMGLLKAIGGGAVAAGAAAAGGVGAGGAAGIGGITGWLGRAVGGAGSAAAAVLAGLGAARYLASGNPLDFGLTPEEAAAKRQKRNDLAARNNPGGSSGAQDAEYRRVADLRRDPEMMREASRGRALGELKPPQVTNNVKTDVKVDVSVKLDGAAIAAIVEKHITKNTTFSQGPAAHDDHAGFVDSGQAMP